MGVVTNCPACGNPLPDGSRFCESCGAAAPVSSTSMDPATIKPGSAPSAAVIAELSGQLIKSLSLGEKLAGAGSLGATIGFFLPWLSAPDLRSLGSLSSLLGTGGIATTSYSGFDAGKVWGGIYLLLAAAIASGVLFFVAGKAFYSKKLLISGFQILIGSIAGPGFVFALLFVPFMQSVAGVGLWLTGVGFCAIAAGGLVTIAQLGKTAR